MRIYLTFFLAIVLSFSAYGQQKPNIGKNKKAVIASIDGKYAQLTELSDKIWAYAEQAFREKNLRRL
jgi:aminobenzoyl-glutamate utilization protein B